MHPLGTIGEPMDIAWLDVFLASDESKWATGPSLWSMADGRRSKQDRPLI
jgi:NAD(P)-dependent dehydrogenase (short-subunit alcohol dehydrogenase family)